MIHITIVDPQQGTTKQYTYNTERIRVSDALQAQGYAHETPCGCIGVCGKCKVDISGDLSEPKEMEQDSGMLASGQRLACTTYVLGHARIVYKRDRESLHIPGEAEETPAESPNEGDPLKSTAGRQVGIAFDIGTTGVSAQLIDLETQTSLKKKSMLNPQARYGNDVLTRICHARDHEGGTQHLQSAILNGMKELTLGLMQGQPMDTLKKVYIAGNTTMQHLIYGVNPAPIAKAPYRPVFVEAQDLCPSLFFGNDDWAEGQAERDVTVTLLPGASAYIGADIIAGLYAVDLQEDMLLIDIGTNGEIVMSSGGRLTATSTAAGPALEGMNIACGMRAEAGAIDRFVIEEDGRFTFTTIKDAPPTGICGSGLVDIMAELVDKQIVLKNGRFDKAVEEPFASQLRDKKFYITEDVYLSQKDIRQIQLAKGAIAAGIRLLYEEDQAHMADCKKILVAGSFGYHLSEASIRKIGLIPKALQCPVEFVGNTSLQGAARALSSSAHYEALQAISRDITVVELSRSAKFQDVFVSELGF